MASTLALFSSLSGLKANSRTIDVVGNNIANVNTTAFKSSRVNFANVFPLTVREGSPPAAESGGVNPYQVGLGVKTVSTQRNFNPGTVSPTGDPRDLAIEGEGMFQVARAGQTWYTRAGNFRPDANQVLVTPTGEKLQGYGVDSNFNIATGQVGDVRIPLGRLSLAESTTRISFKGNLNANGDVPTRGARIDLTGTTTAGLRAIATANPPPATGNVIEGATRLVDVEDPALPASGAALFVDGQTVELRGAEKGNKQIATASLPITATTTVAELLSFMEEAIGIDTTIGNNPDGAVPGASVDAATGVISLIGNTGTSNDLRIELTDLRVVDASGATVRNPFVTTKTASADGESVRTSVVAYDSLGTPVTLDMTMSLVSRGNTGTTWRYSVESADDSDVSPLIATGVLNFDTEGQLATRTPVTISLDRANSGAATPVQIEVLFADGTDNVTSLTDETSQLAAAFRDGSPLGTLSGFGIGPDGTIVGSFTNGLTRSLGQVVVATFTNYEGLVDEGNNLFRPGPNSGPAQVTTAGALGSGQIVGGALELSNVDLSDEFIKMILASTGYSASSRVIRTSDELLQQLLVLGR